MTNQAYHHLKAACVKSNNETAMAHLDAMWRKELDRRQMQRRIDAMERGLRELNINPYTLTYAF